MSPHADLCVQKTWPVLVRLVVEISCLVARAGRLTRPEALNGLRLLRLAESLMRRWLVVKACQRRPHAAPAPRPFPLALQAQLDAAPDTPLFRLMDPAPARSLAAVFTLVPEGEDVPLSLCFDLIAPHEAVTGPDDCALRPLSQIGIWHRTEALLSVIQTPERHIARMRRRLARPARGPLPLRPGRAPGLCQRRARLEPERQGALRDLSQFAREALAGRGPPLSRPRRPPLSVSPAKLQTLY